jgi:hypothetical protein
MALRPFLISYTVCLHVKWPWYEYRLDRRMNVLSFKVGRHLVLQTSEFIDKIMGLQICFHQLRVSFDDSWVLEK